MIAADWIVLIVTLLVIVVYGLYKSRTTKNLDGYFLSNRSLPWYIVLLSIMGTQASAITFLSGPGQAYTDGMRFVQYYFGLPLAMIVICITFVPLFNRLKVYTAYEFLENRFDRKTRTFTSFLFLLQRGLSTGISIYAPSIIVCSLFGWDIFWTNILMGGMLIIYTMSGGAKAVAHTQKIQLLIIFVGMFLVGYTVVKLMPAGIGFSDALNLGGKLGRMNIITDGDKASGFDWTDKYNIWSGVIGGFFLALSYFGTDQSQVGRYLTAKNNRESRLGLLINGLVKIPMQFFILLIGVLIFSFYQFQGSPLSFNAALVDKAKNSAYADSITVLQQKMDGLNEKRKELAMEVAKMPPSVSVSQESVMTPAAELKSIDKQSAEYRKDFVRISKKVGAADTNDTNYIFLSFVKDFMPFGLKGLLIAVIFLAAWGSIAAALNSLAASTVVDFHRQVSGEQQGEKEYRLSKWYTLAWGIFSIIIAQFADKIGQSLIETVNILGSLFYGVILGIFLVAFYMKWVKGTAIFISAIIIEIFIIILFFNEKMKFFSFLPDISFLWMNAIGALGVCVLSWLLQLVVFKGR
jgi:SSS family solute:Na+ symporter